MSTGKPAEQKLVAGSFTAWGKRAITDSETLRAKILEQRGLQRRELPVCSLPSGHLFLFLSCVRGEAKKQVAASGKLKR